MKAFRFKYLITVLVAIATCLLMTTNVANAAPTNAGQWPWSPEKISPSSTYCGEVALQSPRNLAACSAALSNQYRQSVGMTPNPQYLYVTHFGVSQLGWGPAGLVACGYHEAVTLYCNGSVHLGAVSYTGIPELHLNSEMYGTYLAIHEATHHTQTITGSTNLFPIFLSPEVKPFELQSDCVGGMGIAHYIAQGRYSAADAYSLKVFLASTGTTPTHGSGPERAAAFETGLNATSVTDCIGGRFANTPLI